MSPVLDEIRSLPTLQPEVRIAAGAAELTYRLPSVTLVARISDDSVAVTTAEKTSPSWWIDTGMLNAIGFEIWKLDDDMNIHELADCLEALATHLRSLRNVVTLMVRMVDPEGEDMVLT